MEVDDFMRSNVLVRPHTGACSFLYEDWTGLGSLQQLFDIPYDSSLRQIQLQHVHVQGAWDASVLQELILAQFVLSHLVSLTGALDEWIWKPDSAGLFTMRSAYEAVRGRMAVISALEHIQDSRIPLKISIFMWRLFNGFLPFPEVLMSLGVSFAF